MDKVSMTDEVKIKKARLIPAVIVRIRFIVILLGIGVGNSTEILFLL
jgi:hypothetical protein